MKNKCLFIQFIIMMIGFSSCKFFSSVNEDIKGTDYNGEIKSVKFDKESFSINQKESDYLKLTLTPNKNQGKCTVNWTYDENFLSCKTDNFGAVITALKAGTTYIKAECNGIIATSLITILASGDPAIDNPYIYSNYDIIELKPNDTQNISVSLLGGKIEDMEDFTWNIKDPSIADISFSRNNCIISAKKSGSTQLVCSHPKAKYEYSFVVYVSVDKLKETYITTDFNVITINKNESNSKNVTVDLVNPLSNTYKNGFKWDYADAESSKIIQINSNLNTAEIIPLKNGIAKIKVSHENSQYDLNIIVRVTTIVKNVYINVDKSTAIINGSDTPYTIYANIENYDGFANPEEFIFSVPQDAENLVTYTTSGNAITLYGKKNGSFKINVSHPLSEYSRNILVVLQEQLGSAIDSSMYITTNQNFVQTKVGNSPTTINIRLIGGIDGQDNIGDSTTNFNWKIKGGRDNGIVEIQNITGTVTDVQTRSAASSGNSCMGNLVINPIKAGEVTIIVSHPRCLYDTEIKVKVYDKSVIVNPKTIYIEETLIKMLNGETKEIKAELRNHNYGDENNITWNSSNSSVLSVNPTKGQITQIKAQGQGSSQNYVTAHLDGALSDKKILVLQADTKEELDKMKGIYADSTYLRISAEESKTLSVNTIGLDSTDRITWKSDSSSICTVNGDSTAPNCNTATVIGVGEGKTTITATIGQSEPVVFDVTVLKKGESSEILDENAGYLTTNLNAIVIEEPEKSETLKVTGVNISEIDMTKTVWELEDIAKSTEGSAFDIYGSPSSTVTLKANKAGKANIKISNKYSMNSLTIHAKCGELLEWTDEYIPYITVENDVVNIINGSSTTIGASLVNTNSKGDFSWTITKGQDIIEIIGLSSGTCNIKGIQAGQAIITITNTLTGDINKEVLVNVSNTEEELKGFKFLTTKQNVVTIGEQNNTSVTVEMQNSDSPIINGYNWKSINPSIAEVVGSGNVAVIYGKQIGSTKVIVENYEHCDYPLEIIVNVVDPIAASQDPYISCNNIVTSTVGGNNTTLQAELIGGTENDVTGFTWNIVDNSIAQIYASNNQVQIKALKEGTTQIIISHPKASVPRNVLLICEGEKKTNCYISLSDNIVKMSPTDSGKTITASLVNGIGEDAYDFKWWADNYDIINMNYSGGSCLIEPISSGSVTIHVSHPKAAITKDIVIYISQYKDFAFSSNYVDITTGTDSFINMEVPYTNKECYISYESSNNSLCTATGNSSVCILHPGIVPDNQQAQTCTITATLISKGGQKQGEAQLLVSVSKKDETKPYIGLSSNTSSIITLNKGEKRNLSAKLYGKNIVDTSSAGLNWEINKADGEFISFVGDKNNGTDVQITALNSGKTTITLTHKEAKTPFSIYVIVKGESEPVVNLNYSELNLYIGEDTQTLIANVQNDRGDKLTWSIENEKEEPIIQDYFIFIEKGNKAFITPKKAGTAYVKVKLPNESTSICRISIKETEKISFFVYDDEKNYTLGNDGRIKNDSRKKINLSSLQLYPGETKLLHFETIPAMDKITSWYKSDNAYFDLNTVNSGYHEKYVDSIIKETYHYPEGIGTIAITGKATEGNAIIKATTDSKQEASLSISNTYGYLLHLNKTVVSSTPKDVNKNKNILYIDYEIRPACSELIISDITSSEASKNLKLINGTKTASNQWTIKTHPTIDQATGIAKGTLQFEVEGEVNCKLEIKAKNNNVISSGSGNIPKTEFGNQVLKLQVYYPSHTFIPEIVKKVPSLQQNASFYGQREQNAKYSYYDKNTNTIILGDGEAIIGTVSIDDDKEPFSNVFISNIKFEPQQNSSSRKDKLIDGKTQSSYISASKNNASHLNGTNKTGFNLLHQKDYGVFYYKNEQSQELCQSDGMENIYRLTIENDKYIERLNDSIKETSYVGNLVITYFNYAKAKEDVYKIPVYVQVRNNPCCTNTYYNHKDFDK